MESDSLISSLVVIVMYSRYITITINVQTDWKRFHAKQLHLKSIYKLVKVGHNVPHGIINWVDHFNYGLGQAILLLKLGTILLISPNISPTVYHSSLMLFRIFSFFIPINSQIVIVKLI